MQVVTSRDRIKSLQEKFVNHMEHVSLTINDKEIFHHHDQRDTHIESYRNFIFIDGDHLVEINVAKYGKTSYIQGFFVEDDSGENVYLFHRGSKFHTKQGNVAERVRFLLSDEIFKIDYDGRNIDAIKIAKIFPDFDPGSLKKFLSGVYKAKIFNDNPLDIESLEGINKDLRESTLASIKARKGQSKFRKNLIKRYGKQCLISGCRLMEIVEAAHIIPYMGDYTQHPENGLLLRADLHTLYDLNLLGIHPKSLQIELNKKLIKTEYSTYNGKKLLVSGQGPSKKALEHKWKEFNE